MKALLIGGTGTISSEVTKQLLQQENEVWLLNRGNNNQNISDKVNLITCDINDEQKADRILDGMKFDVVCEFIGFHPAQMERDYRLFAGKTKQYIFISSASAYQKPLKDYIITEGTSLSNPYWEYSRNKIACEEYLMKKYREDGFPVTIVRPSHTYGDKSVPVGLHGSKGSFQVLKRMIERKPVIVHGDGTSLWTITHASDFARAFIGLMGNSNAIGEVFHITSEESVTWNQIYQYAADSLGVPLHAYHIASDFLVSVSTRDIKGSLIGDKSNTVVFDNTKIKRMVPNFYAAVRAEEGIHKTVSYVMAHKECQIEDLEFDRWCDHVIEALEKTKKELN